MRRTDREMGREFAEDIVDKCEWASMAMVGEEGEPYSIPLSIVREGQYIYFHSAKKGKKNTLLAKNNRVVLVCVGRVAAAKDKFTTEFESAIVKGKGEILTDREEKIKGLRLLCEKYTPANMENFDRAIAASLERTEVWKISIVEITGKQKKLIPNGKEKQDEEKSNRNQ